jgi:hypothetical protein
MIFYREYVCSNARKQFVLNCRKKTEATIGSPREMLSLCPECFDSYDKERYAEKKAKK